MIQDLTASPILATARQNSLTGGTLGLIIVCALALVPPLLGGQYIMTIGVSAAIFAVIATGFNLVYGFTGLLCLGQVVFLGIGGYASAILVTRYGWSFWLAAPVGAMFSTASGLVIGYASLRLSRHSFGIATLVASLLCLIVARDWVSMTRGPMGIPGLPPPEISMGGLTIVFDRPETYYWLALAFAAVSLFLMWRIVRSRIGRAFQAVRQNEALAQSQGINALKYKLLSIGIASYITGLAGAFMVFHLTIVDPSILDFYYTETMMIMVVIGGSGSFWGVLLAAIAFSIIPDLLRFSTDLRLVIYGALLIVAMLSFPKGVAGLFRHRHVDAWRKRLADAREAQK
jgi:branched-chain amino acid transport system permease protein